MKTFKLMLPLVALFCAFLGTAVASAKVKFTGQAKLGIPYSREYIASQSGKSMARQFFDSPVTFHVTGATSSVARTYSWSVSFVQNGSIVASFYTTDSFSYWTPYSSNEEAWTGATTTVPPGTYTVIISNVSGVGGTYDIAVSYTDANEQGNTLVDQDVITDRQDGVLDNVYVNGTSSIDIVVDKTQF